MADFFRALPKNILAFLSIAGGIVLILVIHPPYTVCESQIEVVKKAQQSFLYREKPNSEVLKTTKYQYLRDRCKASNDPGGCYELFRGVNVLLEDMNALSQACGPAAGSTNEIHRALWETVELLLRLAWGEKPPDLRTAKFGWLDVADVTLFCKLKTRISSVYGDEQWVAFREKMMTELPGAKALTRNQIWDLSLFSENCARYP